MLMNKHVQVNYCEQVNKHEQVDICDHPQHAVLVYCNIMMMMHVCDACALLMIIVGFVYTTTHVDDSHSVCIVKSHTRFTRMCKL